MSEPPSIASALRALAEGLQRAAARWYVFGAQAVVAYGRPRLTADVDVTVDVARERAGELLAILAPHGLELRVDLPPGFVERTRVLAMQLPQLDLARVRHLLALLEEALGRSDLLPELERLVDRAR